MEVSTEQIINAPLLVRSVQILHQRNGQPADSAIELHRIAVMEADRLIKHVKVIPIPSGSRTESLLLLELPR